MIFVCVLSCNIGSSPRSGYPEEEYVSSDDDQAGGYLITLPVNMPGQGSNETVERIFYIQEPLQRVVGSPGAEKDDDVQVDGTKDTTARLEDASSHMASPRSDMAHRSIPNLAGLVTEEEDSGSDVDLEDEELSRVEAEIRGKIMGRSNLGKIRRSSAPQVKTWSSDPDTSSLVQEGIREQDIRIHGPSVSDPHLVTLAFQQAMLAHSQQYMTDNGNESDAENGQSNGMIYKNSLGQLIPVINITPAQGLDDTDDEVQPIFSQVRSNRLDYRFLAPIAEEVGFVGDRSSTRKQNLSSILNAKHEKVHRMSKTTSHIQIMSNWKLQKDVRRSSSPNMVIQRQDATEQLREDDTKASKETDSDEKRKCPPALEGGSVDSGNDPVTKDFVAAEKEESSKNMSPRTLEKIGNVIEGSVEGKERATDPLLETPEWINVEQAMQGQINQGFVAREDIVDTSSNPNGLNNNKSSPAEIDKHEYTSYIDSVEVGSVHKDAEINSIDRVNTEIENMINKSEEGIDSSHPSTVSRSEEDESRPPELMETSEDGDRDVTSFKIEPPLNRQEGFNDGLNDVYSPTVFGQSTDNALIQSKDTISDLSDNIIMSQRSTLDSDNTAMKAPNLGNEGVATGFAENSTDVEPMRTHLTENEKGTHKSRATDELLTSLSKGKRLSKSALSGVNSYPLSSMRGFSIDGNLYVLYPNKWTGNKSKATRAMSEGLRRSENESNKSSLSKKGESMVEGVASNRSASFPIHRKVEFMNIETKREQPRVQIAML